MNSPSRPDRSGDPRRRAAATDPASEPAAPRLLLLRPGWLGLILLGSLIHATTVAAVAATTGSVVAMTAVMALPALATWGLLPASRRRGVYRWPTVWVLTYLVIPSATAPFFVCAQTWLLYRTWLVEHPGQARLPKRLRRLLPSRDR